MKKLFYFIAMLIILNSCTTIKQLSNQKISGINDCKSNEMNSKMIYYDVKIDGFNETLMFDTGATMSVITDSSAINLIGTKKFGVLGSVTGADHKKITLKTFVAKAESELFESENKVFAYIPRPISKCQKQESFKGILGLDVFFKNDNALQLDFSNNKICTVNESQINEIIKNDYTEIKAECKSRQIFVFFKIEGIEYKFKLDTGFSGSLVIPYNEKINFKKFNSLVFVGNMFRTASSTTNGEEIFYENVPIQIGNNDILGKILVSKTIKAQNIGIEIIKGFDWVIDYNKNKVYIKKNSNQIKAEFNSAVFQYVVFEQNNRLVIVTKQKQLSEYNIGDEITSVNNEKVTAENICEMQDLLNKTEDWNSLQIEVIPANKK